MPRDLFGDVTRPSISIGNRKWYTLPVSLLSHSAIVVSFVVIPLLATDVLPAPWQPMEEFILAGPDAAAASPAKAARRSRRRPPIPNPRRLTRPAASRPKARRTPSAI